MWSARPALRLIRASAKIQPCLSCQSFRNSAAFSRYGASTKSPYSRRLSTGYQSRNYATLKLDGPKARAAVDAKSRLGFYTLVKQQGMLKMEPHTAESIYHDFLVQKNKMDHGSNVRRLVKKYQVALDDITSLGMVTFKIPDLSDPARRAQLPQSPHRTNSGLLLQGCAQAEDPLAIVHILTAVHSSSSSSDVSVRDLARLFPQSEIVNYHKTLDALTLKAKEIALGPDALTLKGLFLEQEGREHKAIDMYKEATLRSHLRFKPGSRHPMQLPLITPWNALGLLLKSDKDPELQAQAKVYFEKGAVEADDPLSCFEAAAFEPRTSTKWLQYTSKAAASGHKQAIFNLTDFYREVAAEESPVLRDNSIRKALHWLLGWRSGSAKALAREWLQIASKIGHKPSILQLVDYYESVGDKERAKEYLRRMLEPPAAVHQSEEWPELVQLARKRLTGIR